VTIDNIDPASITCPLEAVRAADAVAAELRAAKDSDDCPEEVKRLGQLHQSLLLRRRELKGRGEPGSMPAMTPPSITHWRSFALNREFTVSDLDSISRRDLTILTAELERTAENCEHNLEYGDKSGPRRATAISLLSRCRFFLRVLETVEEAAQPEDTIGTVFQQVARNELDPVTYQRLVLMAQQRVLMNRNHSSAA
jgi:hypothetical protein